MLLHQLIRTLTADELALLKDAKLSQRHRNVLDAFLLYHNSELPDASILADSVGISRNNLYRQSSAILPICYDVLVADSGGATLRFLSRKFLRKHLLIELQRQESLLETAGDEQGIGLLNETAFGLIMRFTASDFDPKLALSFARKHLDRLDKPDPELALYYDTRIAFQEIVSLPARKRMRISEMAEHSEALLEGLKERISRSKNYRAIYLYNEARQVRYEYVRWDPEYRLTIFEENKRLIENHPDAFPTEWKEMLELRIAELQGYIGKAEEALAVYQRYNPTIPDLIRRGYMYCNNYIILLTVVGRDEEAVRVVNEAFDSEIVRNNPALTMIKLTHSALLALLQHKLVEARGYIERGLAENMEDNFFFLYEVQLRCCEVALAIAESQFELASQLIDRHKKWLRAKRYTLDVTSWGYFFSYASEKIEHEHTGKAIKASTYERFHKQFALEWPNYARLFSEVIVPK